MKMKALKTIAWIVGILVVIGVILNLTVIETWKVPVDDSAMGASIEPMLRSGDVLILTRSKGAGRGDLLRCPDPQAPGRYVVARVQGLGGEEILIEDGLVSLDGKRNPSPRSCTNVTLDDPTTHAKVELVCAVEEVSMRNFEVLRPSQKSERTKTRVDMGRVFLVSDNRQMHVDSRDYGVIDPELCQHVLLRLWGTSGFSDSSRRFTVVW